MVRCVSRACCNCFLWIPSLDGTDRNGDYEGMTWHWEGMIPKRIDSRVSGEICDFGCLVTLFVSMQSWVSATIDCPLSSNYDNFPPNPSSTIE